ncbi:MAG: hypothetical protein HXY40_09420 [Chloroflexi bacterium]|nr:hypothetical protein [Chloroflexota bacterium]
MPYKTEWMIPERVVHQRLYDELTAHEFRARHNELYALAEQMTRPICCIIDTRDVQRIPPLTDLTRYVIEQTSHPQIAWVAVIVTRPLFQFIVDLLIRMNRYRDVRMVASMAEARGFLSSRVPDLVWPVELHENTH